MQPWHFTAATMPGTVTRGSMAVVSDADSEQSEGEGYGYTALPEEEEYPEGYLPLQCDDGADQLASLNGLTEEQLEDRVQSLLCEIFQQRMTSSDPVDRRSFIDSVLAATLENSAVEYLDAQSRNNQAGETVTKVPDFLPAEVLRAPMEKDELLAIETAITGISLPNTAVPEWAKNVPESLWLPRAVETRELHATQPSESIPSSPLLTSSSASTTV